MNKRKNNGFSLVEVLACSALFGLWAMTNLQLLQTSLSAIDSAHQKAQAVEVLMTYASDAQKTWSQGNNPDLSATTGQFDLAVERTSVDEFNVILKVTVSWGDEQKLTEEFWLPR